MNDAKLLIFSLLAGIQREKGYALLSRATTAMSERDAFDAQAARNEAILSQIHETGLPQTTFLPQRIMQSFALRAETAFSESQSHDALAEWYLFQLQQPIQQVGLAILMEWPGLSPSQTSAIFHLLAALDYMGQLRDAGLTVYGRSEISTADTSRIKTLARAYLSRERLFLNLADEKLRQYMHDLKLANPESQTTLDDFLRKLKEGYAKGLISQTPLSVWFHAFDAPLDAFYNTLISALKNIAKDSDTGERFNNLVNALDSDVENNMQLLSTMPLFRGLSESTLRAVLKGAKIIRLDKNQPFIMQDEPVSRFFIVMNGMAKSYKSTEDGSEAILQILQKRDCLADMGTSTNVATISARAIIPTELLALSLPVFREQLTRHQALTQNMLSLTSSRLQKCVAHFEQITLRDAMQRVGWFLVNLHLETGLEGAPLKLPFEKSLIAAYLNIKPETFSRVLKSFKKQGFTIDKDEVILPHPQALCEYCDPEMALRCCRAEAVACPPIQITQRITDKK